ncbi:MAG: phosphorylase [Porphyromonadaceae bacterium]|nr:MAG: phosphorylase [Porphyromonadaceae bacterium]
MTTYSESELVLNPDGSIFHLKLFPEQISDNIILVGDPGRVALVGQFLERVEKLASNREFISLSGYYHNTKITVLSTGIGTDNIDIVVNELDALANINLDLRKDNTAMRRLNLIRIGTSGSLQPDLPAGTAVASAWSVGLDGLMKYYFRAPDPERELFEYAFIESVNWPEQLPQPYATRASARLLSMVDSFCTTGITIAAHGFYGPQGRQLRAKLAVPDLNARLQSFRFGDLRTTNFEMESSALYGLAQLLNHEALTVCLIIANRMTGNLLGDYSCAMKDLIYKTLESITR